MDPTTDVPQTQAASQLQVPNSAGGFSFAVTDAQRLQRFLILGSEGGTFYTTERELTRENADVILRMLAAGQGRDVVAAVLDCATKNRAPKAEPMVFTLALCARCSDMATQQAAYAALPKVCRIPTTLFAFVEFCQTLSQGTGWGRAHKTAIGAWYSERGPWSR